jgi:hypothetical protein
MPDPSSNQIATSSFSRLAPRQARVVLLAFVVASAALVAITLSPWKSGRADKPGRGVGDVDLFLMHVALVRSGGDYYETARLEMQSRGYPTRSVFNWRTPLPVWLVAQLPSNCVAVLITSILAICVLMFGCVAVARDGGLGRAGLCLLFLSGAVMPGMLKGAFILPEVWSGLFIGLSLCFYGLGRRTAGILLGITALFFRELAAPYCVVCFALAVFQRRRYEVIGWIAGFAAYAAFYAWHVSRVLPLMSSDGLAHENTWLQFGGAAFVISLVQTNAYLLLMPQWVTAVFFALALVGFAGWQSQWGKEASLAACAYVVAFGIVGYAFNQYWGAIFAPLLAFGAAQGPGAIRDLLKQALIQRKVASVYA